MAFFQGGGGSCDIVGTVGGEGDSSNVLIWRIFPRQYGVAAIADVKLFFVE